MNIHVHHHNDQTTHALLREIIRLLERGNYIQETIMAAISNFNDLLNAMNDTTNQIAANVQALLDKLNAGGMSAAEEQEVLDKMQAQADALKAVAASSANPAPPVPPV